MTDSRCKTYRSVLIALFLIAAGSFLCLDLQAVWTGDDMGYMFTDSSIHKGDGKRLTNISDILPTQIQHWRNCNGRIIIHCIVMLFTGILGKGWFAIANSLVFGALAVMFFKFIAPQRENSNAGIIELSSMALTSLLLLWLALPRPGVTMLSLASYAVNYLWTATATTGFLLLWRKNVIHNNKSEKHFITPIVALIVAALQESFSLPLSAAFLLWWIIRGKNASAREISVIICYWVGTLLVFLAPGNLSHASQGGGFSFDSLADKATALSSDVLFSSINLLAIIIILGAVLSTSKCAKFCRNNLLLLAAIVASLLLASVSYTAIRQLFAPSLFAAILLGRIFFTEIRKDILRNPLTLIGVAIIYSGTIAGAYIIRIYPQKAMESVHAQSKQGKSIITLPANNEQEGALFHFLFDRYNDDPTLNKDLKLLFDGYTKQGLSRLYGNPPAATKVTTFLPAPSDTLRKYARNCTVNADTLTPAPFSQQFSVAALPIDSLKRPIYKLKYSDDSSVPYERFISGDSVYYVIPASDKTLILKPRK